MTQLPPSCVLGWHLAQGPDRTKLLLRWLRIVITGTNEIRLDYDAPHVIHIQGMMLMR